MEIQGVYESRFNGSEDSEPVPLFFDCVLNSDDSFPAAFQGMNRAERNRAFQQQSLWDSTRLPLPDSMSQFDSLSEPVVVSNLKGNLHLSVIGSNTQSQGIRGGLFVLTSRNGDRWDGLVKVFSNNAGASVSEAAMACDITEMIGSSRNPYRNRLYLAWSVESTPDSSSKFSQILFAASVDGGNTFQLPVHGAPRLVPLRLNLGKAPVLDPGVKVDESGRVTVSWTQLNPDGSMSRVSRSSENGGQSFGTPNVND